MLKQFANLAFALFAMLTAVTSAIAEQRVIRLGQVGLSFYAVVDDSAWSC